MTKMIRKTLEEILQTTDKTDWEKVDAITDEALNETVKNDPDDVYLTDEDFANGGWVKRDYSEPKNRAQITIRLDEDILSFFRQKGKEVGRPYQGMIRSLIDAYVSQHKG